MSKADTAGLRDVIAYVRHPGRGLQERLDNVSFVSSPADLFIYLVIKEKPLPADK